MAHRILKTFSIVGVAAAIMATAAIPAQKAQHPMSASSGRVRAPEFPTGLSWFNTDRPLGFDSDLKGRIVVLDFWTYCCINCMHVLPELAKVEEHYEGQPVVVLGVHSNKFANESEAANVRAAILRYDIKHPVVVDEAHWIWESYTVRAWPTLMFVDSTGKVVGRLEGENKAETIIQVVDQLLAEGRAAGTLAAGPPELRPEKMVPSSSGLAFPGKVLADPAGKRLFIADSGHHRIVQASLDGKILAVYGSGEAGLVDGPAKTARFRNPQGMALDRAGGVLFIADTDNHALRQIDLSTGNIKTLAGTGQLGNDRSGGRVAKTQPLNSPWDLALDGNTLYIAMAGTHQLWTYDRATYRAQAWVGSGLENIRDGVLTGAALAQPSGLALAGGRLYFADSEVSAVRYAELSSGRVRTLIGTGLFNFGDRIGMLPQALLQHPLGVAADDRNVYVADTYNHKIKRIELAAGKIETLYGNNNKKNLYEPGGLSLADGKLYVADTNHHRIIVMDTAGRNARELALMGWPGETAPKQEGAKKEIAIGPLKTSAEATLVFDIKLPESTKVNTLAPMTVRIAPVGHAKLIATENAALQVTAPSPKLPFEVKVPLSATTGEGVYHIELTFAYCTEADEALCIPVGLQWQARITASKTGAIEARIAEELKPTQ